MATTRSLAMAPEESIYLYPGSMVMAIFVIVYTLGSAFAAALCHVIYRLNHKEVVYVSLLSVSVFVQQLFTISQAVVEIVDYPGILERTYKNNLSQWRAPKASPAYHTSPNLAIQIMFGIRMYFFNTESLLFFFWSLMLFVSVWEVESRWLQSERFVRASKWACFIVPALQAIFQYLPMVAEIPVLQISLANFIIIWSLTSGCIFLFLILIRCFQVMWDASSYNVARWTQWTVYDYGNKKHSTSTCNSTNPSVAPTSHAQEDRYILLCFILGFVIISGLQCSFLLSQYVYALAVFSRSTWDAPRPTPGWTHGEQLEDQAFFLAGSSTGYLVLLVFGTTRESRQQLKRIFKTGQIRTINPSPTPTPDDDSTMRPAAILRNQSPAPLPLRGHARKRTMDSGILSSARALSFMLSPGRASPAEYRRMNNLEP